MKLRVSSCLLFVALLVPFPIAAQQAPPLAIDGQVDRLAADEMASLHEPSLAISIVNAGKLIFTKGYGVSDVENHVPATADTVYRIASVSKSLTATAAMRLVEEHRLDLDAPVQKYCPAFPTKQWPITVREVLTHESGIRHYKNDDESINTRHYTSIDEAQTQNFAKDPLFFEPGTKFSYTSYGYIVLGCVMEDASGMSYTTYMQQSIFEPAGMAPTRLDDVFAIIPHRARGYSIDEDGRLQNVTLLDISNKPPGSGINSTARDLGLFMVALYGGKLVTPATWSEMITPAKTRAGKPTIYGYGWFVGGPISSYHGLREVGHGGDVQGFANVLYAIPERRFAVVVLSNGENEKVSIEYIALARKIYDVVTAH
ncbi:MAG TPA: serine hydrolase domain-containing protein [Terriglobales bacterium]|nr:serine hydrolase domain-containing protein [Terriglobales bacterium]